MNFREWLMTEAWHTSEGRWSVRSNGLLVILVDEGIGDYYRMWFNKTHRVQNIRLMKPKWGSHISVTREGEPARYDVSLIKSLDGQPVTFRYTHEMDDNANHYWLDVECPAALDLREKLGLPRQPEFALHLTVGIITSDSTRPISSKVEPI